MFYELCLSFPKRQLAEVPLTLTPHTHTHWASMFIWVICNSMPCFLSLTGSGLPPVAGASLNCRAGWDNSVPSPILLLRGADCPGKFAEKEGVTFSTAPDVKVRPRNTRVTWYCSITGQGLPFLQSPTSQEHLPALQSNKPKIWSPWYPRNISPPRPCSTEEMPSDHGRECELQHRPLKTLIARLDPGPGPRSYPQKQCLHAWPLLLLGMIPLLRFVQLRPPPPLIQDIFLTRTVMQSIPHLRAGLGAPNGSETC
jgi:hypothetical protein